MRILDAKIRWNERHGNDPEIMVLVNGNMPMMQERKYVKKNGLYYSESGGWVSLFSYHGPGDGYGGRSYRLKMMDGTEEILHGPFSSRPGVANAERMSDLYNSRLTPQGVPHPCGDVLFFTDEESFNRGWTAIHAAFTLPHLCKACELAKAYLLVKWMPQSQQSADLSKEQMECINHVLGRRKIHEPWDMFGNINPGVEFSFIPSLHESKLIKGTGLSHGVRT